MRLFIAINLPPQIKEELGKIQKDLVSRPFPISTLKKDQLHLTLAFLGERGEEKISQIEEAVKKVTEKMTKFKVYPKNFGAFPNFRYPKILWIGMGGQTEKIYALQKQIFQNLKKIGIKLSDENFKPHITIGKVKSYANKKVARMIGEELQRHYSQNLEEFEVSEVILFRSNPTPWGHVHNPIGKYELSKKN